MDNKEILQLIKDERVHNLILPATNQINEDEELVFCKEFASFVNSHFKYIKYYIGNDITFGKKDRSVCDFGFYGMVDVGQPYKLGVIQLYKDLENEVDEVALDKNIDAMKTAKKTGNTMILLPASFKSHRKLEILRDTIVILC